MGRYQIERKIDPERLHQCSYDPKCQEAPLLDRTACERHREAWEERLQQARARQYEARKRREKGFPKEQTDEQMLLSFRKICERFGKIPSRGQLSHTSVSPTKLHRRFGGIHKAAEAAGLTEMIKEWAIKRHGKEDPQALDEPMPWPDDYFGVRHGMRVSHYGAGNEQSTNRRVDQSAYRHEIGIEP